MPEQEIQPLSDSLANTEIALARYLAAIALEVCDRWDADDVDDDAMSNDIARLRRIAEASIG